MPCSLQQSAGVPAPSPLDPDLPPRGEAIAWNRLTGDSLPLALAGAAGKLDGVLAVITPNMQSAELLHEQIGFFLAGSGLQASVFPDWETLPYDTFSPHQDIISQRLATLNQLGGMRRGILIVSIATLLQRLPPVSYINGSSLMLRSGQQLDPAALRAQLDNAGYQCVSQVMEHGEFAVRGSLLDLYPMGSPQPLRIDLFDEEIESLRIFDPDTQCSVEEVDEIELLPAREFPFDAAAIKGFRRRYRAHFEGDPQGSPVYRDVSQGIAPGGIEYYLPLFFEQMATLFDYLPARACVALLDAAEAAAEDFRAELDERYESHRHDRERPILEPGRLYLHSAELHTRLADLPVIRTRAYRQAEPADEAPAYNTQALPDVALRPRQESPAAALLKFIAGFPGRILLTAESTGRRETLIEQLRAPGIRPSPVRDWAEFLASEAPLCLCVAPLEQGVIIAEPALCIIPEARLFGERAGQARRRKPARDPAAIIRNLTDLALGAPVVHEQHGVGRYRGLVTLTVHDIPAEYLHIEYAGGDKLYVPVASLQLVSRYTGAAAENAPLHKLGGDQWQRARQKAARRVQDVAAELLDIYARRAARKGHACAPPADDYAAFAAAFPFEETPDQEASIHRVLHDLQSGQPMDHVVCGDVGFGKTEVAMRAAFLAVQGGRQVALLVPTTLLAQQHYQNFSDRFSDWPVRVEVLSRFRTGKQQEAILQGIAAGSVDIVIGTHKLLQESVRFKRLGLAIIDEEHRFGVRQKERLKKLRTEVDVLTLTATPIPRTLNMALSGLRELSIISTPPAHRLAIKTFISDWNAVSIREACLREIKRGGQVYVLHNEVESIERIAGEIARIVPEAAVEIAHGQMRERDLEHIMLDFYHRRFNVLVCTTIIESGIDIPTANTIIINRADKLGLAQLHQLRGRVGRSHHRAYAYLLVPPRRNLTADAVKRLEAIAAMEDLGAGFTLATHDLEIRGAGELLGDEQSGQIHEIGYALYTDLLERAVSALKAGRRPELEKPLHQGPEIDLQIPALIPDDYIPDVHTRLVMYKRIAAAGMPQELRELQVEMIDRFGLLPDAVSNLFRVTELKLLAEPLGVAKIEVGRQDGRLVFGPEPDIDTGKLVELVQEQPQTYRFDGGNKLRFNGDFAAEADRFRLITGILATLKTRSDRETSNA